MGYRLEEVGGFRKRKARLRIALVYPNVYRIGMASLGYHTVYSLLNGYDDVACERFFTDVPKSMESNSALSAFDVIAFSLQYEPDCVNMVHFMVQNRMEPLRSLRRGPVVICGGPCCYNPLPMVDFADLFVIGDLEPLADRLVEMLLDGVEPQEMATDDGLMSAELRNPTKAAKAKDLNSIPAPINQPRPRKAAHQAALGSTFMVEISRGCNVRCRFCMYSHCTLPKRERSLERIKEIVEEGLRVTGARKVSLVGALVTDHSEIKDILGYFAGKGLDVSLPSIRTNEVDEELLDLLGRLRIKTLTLAPEGSPHIRDVLKKDLREDKVRFVTDNAADYGVRRLKLYFITGVPGETKDDLAYIADFCNDLVPRYPLRQGVVASVNPLVPKPHAPTEVLAMVHPKTIKGNYAYLRKSCRRGVGLNFQSTREAVIQAYLSLGDARTGRVMLEASKGRPSLSAWRRAAETHGDPISRVYTERRPGPWHLVDAGIPPSYLQRQFRQMIGNALAA